MGNFLRFAALILLLLIGFGSGICGLFGLGAVAVGIGCVLGSILGGKAAVWLQQPAAFVAGLRSPEILWNGQSIVGALIGGWLGVEIAKRIAGIRKSTGDAFVLPLIAGIAIGRIGCFLAGLHDD